MAPIENPGGVKAAWMPRPCSSHASNGDSEKEPSPSAALPSRWVQAIE